MVPMDTLFNIIKLIIFIGYIAVWSNILVRLTSANRWLGFFFGLFIVFPASFGLHIPYWLVIIIWMTSLYMVMLHKQRKLARLVGIFSLKGLTHYWATTCLIISFFNLLNNQGTTAVITTVITPTVAGSILFLRANLISGNYFSEENNL